MKMTTKRLSTIVTAGTLAATLALAGCSAGSTAGSGSSPSASNADPHAAMGHGSAPTGTASADAGAMDHPMDGGPVPEGMTAAANPKFAIGSQVTLTADHMSGMSGASAKIVGAYDTVTYAVNFTPTTGGPAQTDHKWVVQEELEGAGDTRLADGAETTLNAEHMAGMDGAKATIASSTDETVYVVDYTAGGMTMTNHKWVTESEIRPAS